MVKAIVVLLALGWLGTAHAADWNEEANRVVVAVEGNFSELRSGLENAIVNEGLVVSSVSHVGEMLERTGKDLGETTPIFGKAEIIEFCSALLTRRMVEVDPSAIVNCPYRIAMFTLPAKPALVHFAYPKPNGDGDRTVYRNVEALLKKLVEEAQW